MHSAEKFCVEMNTFCKQLPTKDAYCVCMSTCQESPIIMTLVQMNDLHNSLIHTYPGFKQTNRLSWAAPVITQISSRLKFDVIGVDISYYCFSTSTAHQTLRTKCIELYHSDLKICVRLSQTNDNKYMVFFLFRNQDTFASPTYHSGNSFLRLLRYTGKLPMLKSNYGISQEVTLSSFIVIIVSSVFPLCFLFSFMSTQIIREAIEASTPLAKLFLQQTDDQPLELETRLGTISANGRFTPSVSREFFMHWLEKLESYHEWNTVNDWAESMDVIWANDVRGTKTMDLNESRMTFQKKKLIRNMTFLCKERPYSIRMSLKTEIPVEGIPQQDSKLIRIKRRKEFNYKNIVMYSFTVISEAKDKIRAIKNGRKSYEIEFELMNMDNCRRRDASYLVATLLEKPIDFLGRTVPYSLRLL